MKLKILRDFEIGPTGNTQKMVKGTIIEWPTGDPRILSWMADFKVETAPEDAVVT